MEKIDIRELSIGDWVYHDDIVFGREIAKVHRLNKDKHGETIGITVYRSDGEFGVVGYIYTFPTNNDIHPIPITPEILEKNGWKLSKSNWFEFEDGEWKINIWIGKSKCNIEISQKREIYASTYADIQVIKSNINTLQHALRLAGVDKEITL